jgi:hypothetical protein
VWMSRDTSTMSRCQLSSNVSDAPVAGRLVGVPGVAHVHSVHDSVTPAGIQLVDR